MPSCRVARPIFGPQRQSRNITTVTRFSLAGMVPKHVKGRFSPDNLVWEISMPLGKKFFRRRWPSADVPLAHVSRPALAGAARLHSASRAAVPCKTILSAALDLTLKTVAWCAAQADFAFINLPAAIFSWILTQFFVGCAAYAEAMYPNFANVHASQVDSSQVDSSQVKSSKVDANQVGAIQVGAIKDADRHHPLRNAGARRDNSGAGNSSRSPSLAPDLAELSRFAIGAGARRPQVSRAGRTRSSAAKSGGGNIVLLSAMRPARPGRLGAITEIVATWLSRRRQRANRPVTAELGNHDQRAPREVWMARYGID